MISKFHYFYLLDLSPWPVLCSLSSFNLFFSFLLFLKFGDSLCFLMTFFFVIIRRFYWWISYLKEFNSEGKDSFILEFGLKYSIILFISSEVFFFFSFFWSYFHFFLSPRLELGVSWPPFCLQMFDFLNVPLINTLILIRSGVTITIRHHYLISGKNNYSNFFLFFTVILGLLFSLMQLIEYNSSFFSLRDGTFGSTFFMLTGFHGLHVLIGTIFLFMVLFSSLKFNIIKNNCLSFELASWYWHFVDVVWIFLYFLIYYMNN